MMGLLFYTSCLFLTTISTTSALGADGLAVVVICQKNPVSQEKCREKEGNIREQARERVEVILSTRDFYHDGDWTIFPVIPVLSKNLRTHSWFLICTEHTTVDIPALLQSVGKMDPDSELFMGHGLSDREPTIIHHFSSKTDFLFPLLPAGFLLSRALLKKLTEKMKAEFSYKNYDFSIDASYEFSTFLSEMGSTLTHSDKFCVNQSPGCATFVHVLSDSREGFQVNVDNVFFAVKTCEKFHRDRVPVVLSTWGKKAKHIAYYSDVYDESIPTVVLNVSNSPQGHCEKTRAIIRALKSKLKANPNLKWAAITDDDTILSVSRVVELVSGYNSSEALAIGERYGYNLQQSGGYNYLTGGGGVILSRATLMQFRRHTCLCPSPTSPDDMFLFGVCFRRLDISLIHTPLMHQARPNDYNADYLAIGPPVSFHKHWMVDPHLVYRQWFHNYDSPTDSHDEL